MSHQIPLLVAAKYPVIPFYVFKHQIPHPEGKDLPVEK